MNNEEFKKEFGMTKHNFYSILLCIGLFIILLLFTIEHPKAETLNFQQWGCGNSSVSNVFNNSFSIRTCPANMTWLNVDFPTQWIGSVSAHARVEIEFQDTIYTQGYKTINIIAYFNGQPTSSVSKTCPIVQGSTDVVCDIYFNNVSSSANTQMVIQLQLVGDYFKTHTFRARVSGSLDYNSQNGGLTNGSFNNGINSITNNNNQNTQDIINNNNQNTQDIIDSNNQLNDSIGSLEDNILNDSVSASTGDDFFSNFEDDSHGLSGIITAPLFAIRRMLVDECQPIGVTYKGKTISFDCGYSFWNRLGGLYDFYNLTAGGLLMYALVRALFLKVHQIKDPEDDRVEVMSL